jgi:hypothetical protein
MEMGVARFSKVRGDVEVKESSPTKRVHWSHLIKNVKQMIFDELKNAAPNNDLDSNEIQIPMRAYSSAVNRLLYQLTDRGTGNALKSPSLMEYCDDNNPYPLYKLTDKEHNELESAGRAFAAISIVSFLAGKGNPVAFESWEKKLLRSRAENARTQKLPQHILDRIVIEALEDSSLPASERAAATKPRRDLLSLAIKKLGTINAQIAEERNRYNLPTDEPYYKGAESIYRRYRDARKRTAI